MDGTPNQLEPEIDADGIPDQLALEDKIGAELDGCCAMTLTAHVKSVEVRVRERMLGEASEPQQLVVNERTK